MIFDENILTSEAWHRVWRLRCCPPQLDRWRQTSELQAHLDICPYCRQELEEEFGIPAGTDKPAAAQAEPTNPQPGEIWALDKASAGWGVKDRYYNPPLVLVVREYDDDRIQVMQIYDDLSLAGPDDILLTPAFEAFVETWNSYTIPREAVSTRLGRVGRDQLSRCLEPVADSGIAQGSLLWFFRNLEVECGFYFYRHFLDQAGGVMLQRMDDPQTLRRGLERLGLSCPYSDDMLEIFAGVTAPDEAYPLAAAEQGRQRDAMLFLVKDDEVVEYRICPVNMNQCDWEEERLLVGGVVEGEGLECDVFHVWWKRGDVLQQAIPSQSGYHESCFWAAFDTSGIISEPETDAQVNLVLRFFSFL